MTEIVNLGAPTVYTQDLGLRRDDQTQISIGLGSSAQPDNDGVGAL